MSCSRFVSSYGCTYCELKNTSISAPSFKFAPHRYFFKKNRGIHYWRSLRVLAHSARDTPDRYTMISSGMRVWTLTVSANCFNEAHIVQSSSQHSHPVWSLFDWSARTSSAVIQITFLRVAGISRLIVGRAFKGVIGHVICCRENGFVTQLSVALGIVAGSNQ